MQSIDVTFSEDLDVSSVVTGEVRAVTTSGAELNIDFMTIGDTIVVMPPPAGWGAEPFSLELHAGLRSMFSQSLSSPVALPFRP